jgi:hypothetical protein
VSHCDDGNVLRFGRIVGASDGGTLVVDLTDTCRVSATRQVSGRSTVGLVQLNTPAPSTPLARGARTAAGEQVLRRRVNILVSPYQEPGVVVAIVLGPDGDIGLRQLQLGLACDALSPVPNPSAVKCGEVLKRRGCKLLKGLAPQVGLEPIRLRALRYGEISP